MTPDMSTGAQDRSLGELLSELTQEVKTLFQQEVRLAKAEMTEKVTGVGRDLGVLAAGGLIAYVGLMTLVAALVIILAELGVPWWASALIVGAILAAAGGMMISKGLKGIRSRDMAPRQTVETLKEDARWAQGQTS